jgi:hypothetical protein
MANMVAEKIIELLADNHGTQVTNEMIARAIYGKRCDHEEFKVLWEDFSSHTNDVNIKDYLLKFKNRIERALINILTDTDEVKNLLKNFVQPWAMYASKETNFQFQTDLLLMLIRALYKKWNWSKPVQDHFEYVYPKLAGWFTFFFSYTNKDAKEMNQLFAILLSEESTVVTKNAIANRFADLLIKRENLKKGFFDSKDVEWGDPFQQDIDNALNETIVFVQLISKGSFSAQGYNWCDYELKKFREIIEERAKSNPNYEQAFASNICFILTTEKIDQSLPQGAANEYPEWIDLMSKEDYEKLIAKTAGAEEFLDLVANCAAVITKKEVKLIESI